MKSWVWIVDNSVFYHLNKPKPMPIRILDDKLSDLSFRLTDPSLCK